MFRNKTHRQVAGGPILAIVALALLAGCANQSRHSIEVGSTPDDYRTNHPIMIAEKERVIDLAVGASDRGATKHQTDTIAGFLSDYDRKQPSVLAIMVPQGSANSIAAQDAARDFATIAKRQGVPESRVVISAYQAGSANVSAPVRLTYSYMAAQTDKCGRWPEDMLANGNENKHWANYGCSAQNNLAAQMANPNDLLGPRKPTTIDAEDRSAVIDDYRETITTFEDEDGF